MKVCEAVHGIMELKPHQFADDIVVGWLRSVDGQIYNDYIRGHEGDEDMEPTDYDTGEHYEDELLVPAPYDEDVYMLYLSAQVDFYNGDFDRYNNGMVRFNVALSAFVDHFNRTHPARQPVWRVWA